MKTRTPRPRRRSPLALALFLSCAALPSVTRSAPPQTNSGGGGSAGGGALTIGASREYQTLQRVLDPAVSADLEIPPAQRRILEESQRRCDAAYHQLQQTVNRLERAGPLAPNFGRDLSAAYACAERDIQAAMKPALASITPAQQARLREIEYQHPLILVNPTPDLVDALGLTPQQLEQARQISKEAQADSWTALRSGFRPPNPVRREFLSRDGSVHTSSTFSSAAGNLDPANAREVQQRIHESMAREDRRLREEVLTPDQQQRLRKLQGRPLKPSAPSAPRTN
ncbi:MAG: hypothetical protein IT580_16995 [Verrucomicrobiales bacterium]|nr:hypothetical protein [Verrucomicrobiales bacterium]